METITQTYDQPKNCDRTNMQINFLANFPRSRQQKLMERWFSASANLNKMDSAKAIEEKLVKAEQRRLARFEKTESTDEKVIRAMCTKMDKICPTSPNSVTDKLNRAQMRKDELLAAKLSKLADHHYRVGSSAVDAKKEAAEIDRKYAQLQKEKAAEERVRLILEQKKAKAAASANRSKHLKKAVEEKLQNAEQELKLSEIKLIESYIGKSSFSMPRMSVVEESIEREVKGEQEVAPKTLSLDRSFYKKAFANEQMPNLKNFAVTATASNQADAEMSSEVEQTKTAIKNETTIEQKIVTVNGQKMLMTVQTSVSFQPI